MLRAILFDFNGVIVGDEPLHFKLFQKTARQAGVELSQKDYYEKYLGYDDYDCFGAILRDHGKTADDTLIAELTRVKNDFYFEEIRNQDLFIPGVKEFIEKVSDRYYLAVVSGALRNEIEAWLKKGNLHDKIQEIVSADDTERGKPDPEGYYRALNQLNCNCVQDSNPLLPQECLVIEDSLWGIQAAHAASMKCLALMTSYGREALKEADWVCEGFETVDFEAITAAM